MIVYGGFTAQGVVGDTWTLSNASGGGSGPTWAMLVPGGNAGPPFYLNTAIYDPTSNEVVSFGGIPAIAATPTTADDFIFVLIKRTVCGHAPSQERRNPSQWLRKSDKIRTPPVLGLARAAIAETYWRAKWVIRQAVIERGAFKGSLMAV